MKLTKIYDRAFKGEPLTAGEGLALYNNGLTEDLMFIANNLRQNLHPGNEAGWMIDRNVNITNVCFSQCSFCNFCRKKSSEDAYITSPEEYIQKINELYSFGGDQILLQGGMNPELGLDFYTSLFTMLKSLYPTLKLHALGPPEIVYLSKKEHLTYSRVLIRLIESGLDSLPGAGAEILSDRVRKIVSPGKATTKEWLEVMHEAHILNLPTSATMMFGHVETRKERIQHLINLRSLQEQKPAGNYGFIAFIPWPFQDKGTVLSEKSGIKNSVNGKEYIRTIAISRIMLNNIRNIQSSILTVGKEIAMLSLHSGANDIGSIMIEENVVSAAGAANRFDSSEMQTIIREAGFIPRRRNQKYETVI
ncbi:MAG: dehypoxanthine futalosine cyclase [Odoribacter sp.]|nr:dehypoxanthine futalosine cyclase [Odoribacter sp.]